MVFFQILPYGLHSGIEVFPALFGESWRRAAELDEEESKEGVDGDFATLALLLLLAMKQA